MPVRVAIPATLDAAAVSGDIVTRLTMTAGGSHKAQTMTVDKAAAPDWKRLYDEHHAAMFRVAAIGLGHARANADPLDVVHDAFASVMRKPPANVDNWEALLIKATLRRVKDHHKRADQARTSPTIEGIDGELDACGKEWSEAIADQVMRQAHAASVRAQLREILDILSPQQREVATRRIIEGESVTAIAADLSTSAANVSKL